MTNDDDRELADAKDLLVAEEVIAAMRHDVRNKLAAIRQAAYYLKTKSQTTELWESDPRMARFFGLIDAQVDEADALFGATPFLEKLHARDPSPRSTSALIEGAVAAAGAAGRITVGPIGETEVTVDRGDLVLALKELIDNAIEASPSEGVPRIGGASRDEHYVFTVSNPGTPLDARAFRNFVRGFTSSRPDRRGLGLSIARRVAGRYGGILSLREGTTETTIDLSVRADGHLTAS
jgi:signal transduction histidine kinase